MQCLQINIRRATFIILSVIVNNINIIQMAENLEINKSKNSTLPEQSQSFSDLTLQCPSNTKCELLNAECLNCTLNYSCIYGEKLNVTCEPKQMVNCIGSAPFKKQMICRYCYQTDSWESTCEKKANCNSVSSPPEYYVSNCTVRGDILCLGSRTFNKNIKCNWTRGYRWTTALLLSITLGGFGADRFYLGHWQEGIGKLFSFGGLGVWTLIDVILISLHYLGPADGSLYI